MESRKPAARAEIRKSRRGAGAAVRTAGLAVLLAAILAGCDAQVGIEGTDFHRDDSGSAAAQSTAPQATPAQAAAHPGTQTPAPRNSAAASPAAANRAITAWAQDLRQLGPAALERKCWMIAPHNVDTMYAGKQAIASALAQPSTDNGTATTWKSANGAAPPVTVVAQDSD
ncbi:MAG: hypothetical protein J2P18_08475, partial [Nocardia sp.]|nr:hypothetical protein [Nocardia sp.]